MKKWTRLIIAILIIINILSVVVYASEEKYTETNGVKLYTISDKQVQGFVDIQGETTKSKIKLMVVRNNEQIWYDVKLENGRFSQKLWLNNGKGKYTVHVMVNEYDRKYSFGPKVTVENVKEINALLAPEKYIESGDKPIIDKAAEITKGLTSDREKAKAIYKWVSENIDYDYATLVAALGRAYGLQTKVVKGTGKINGKVGYHAWNEIYIEDEDKWIKLDTTFAAVSSENYFDIENFDESHTAE